MENPEIRAQFTATELARRVSGSPIRSALTAIQHAARATYNLSIVIGLYVVGEGWRITEDGELRLTEDNIIREVDG